LKNQESYELAYVLGGLPITATVGDSPTYRRLRGDIDNGVKAFLVQYNQRNETMTRHDAAMVCGTLSLKLKGFGVDVLKPFTVSPPPEQQSAR
jgi:hypothetical protein